MRFATFILAVAGAVALLPTAGAHATFSAITAGAPAQNLQDGFSYQLVDGRRYYYRAPGDRPGSTPGDGIDGSRYWRAPGDRPGSTPGDGIDGSRHWRAPGDRPGSTPGDGIDGSRYRARGDRPGSVPGDGIDGSRYRNRYRYRYRYR